MRKLVKPLFFLCLFIKQGLQANPSKNHESNGLRFQTQNLQLSQEEDSGGSTSQRQSSIEEKCKLFSPLLALPLPSHNNENHTLWNLLDKGRSQLKLSETFKDVTLFLGNTGSGKTTVTQLLVGNPSELEVVKLVDKPGFMIIDHNDKIGHTTFPKTLVPELVLDPSSGLAIYDCPGFSDSLPPEIDITTNYLLNSITNHVHSVKLAFVVVYTAVQGTKDQTGFDQLARHAVKMMHNLGKFNNSISLLVTKTPKGVPEERLLNRIRSFLTDYKSFQERRLNEIRSAEAREVIRKKIEFVDILLHQDRIAFIPRAEACGKVSQDPELMASRDRIRHLLNNELEAISVVPEDFEYALTDASLRKLERYVDEIQNRISSIGASITGHLVRAQEQTVQGLDDFRSIKTFLNEEYSYLYPAIKAVTEETNGTTSSIICAQVEQILGQRNYTVGQQNLKNLNQMKDYLTFFAKMRPSKASYITEIHGISSIQNWVEQIGKRQQWYEFLIQMQKQLSEFSFQRNRPSKTNIPSHIELSFLANQLGFEVEQSVRDLYAEPTLTDLDKIILRSLILQALEPVRFTCKNDKMDVSGTFIKVSDFVESNGKCKICPAAKKVQVLASEVIYIDQDIEPAASQIQQLTLVAPVWDVVTETSVRINLSGGNGSDPISGKANNGVSDGRSGDAGFPGAPGSPGGYFYGLVDQVVGTEKLSILANGGTGGRGQDGGDGHEGAKGRDVPYSEWPSCWTVTWVESSLKYFDGVKSGAASNFELWLMKYGEEGKQGGNGGAGGAGGKGGYAGKLELFQFNGSKPLLMALDGSSGDGGRGGQPGNGGPWGVGKHAKMTTSGALGCGYSQIVDATRFGHGPSGNVGDDGTNTVGQSQPKSPEYSEDKNHWEGINNFKALALKNEHTRVRNNFVLILESSDEIAELYTPTAFSHELLNMENFSLTMKLQDSSWLRPKYERYMERLNKYAKLHTFSQEEKKVLAVLYTTASSTTLTAMERLGSTVVVNVEGFMETVLQRFQRYTQLEAKVLVEEQRTKYEEIFSKKIEQAISFISGTVEPEMNKLAVEQQRASEDLSAAIVQLRDASIDNVAILKAAQRQMKETLIVRKVLGGLKVAGQIISMFGAHGAVIGGVIGGGASVVDQFALGDYSKGRKEIKLPPSVKDYAKNMETAIKPTLDQKLKDTGTLIEAAEKALNTDKEVMGNIEGKVADLKKKRREIIDGGIGAMRPREMLSKLNELRAKEKELNKSLEDKKKTFQETFQRQSATKKEKARAARGKLILSKLGNVVSLGETALEFYNKVENDKAKIEEFSKMIQDAEDDIKDANAKEEAVTGQLIPYTEDVTASLSEISENLGSQSSVSLLVRKWEVKKMLSNYQDFLSTFTQGFLTVSQRFQKCVNGLTEAMALLIDLYDYLEKYREHMEFADYIANLNSPAASSVPVQDPYIPGIQLALQANILLSEYAESIKAFKQWVFPYGSLFQSEYALPTEVPEYLRNATGSSLAPADITRYLVPSLINEIQNLRTRLAQYRAATFQNMDVNLITTKFNSEGKTTQPFQVWDGEGDRESIRELLSGKRVSFWADPERAYAEGKSAVKFRIAEFQPTAKDPAVLSRLDRILKEFAVIMTHSGASHYMYSHESVTMVGENATFRYNFERDPSTGERYEPNAVYLKVKEGNYILSPYTLWTVQLIKATSGGEFDFKDLAALSDGVYLELVGEGTYVDERDHVVMKSLVDKGVN